MKFKTAASVNGTGFRDYLTSNYSELVTIFGPPTYGPNADLDKTTCEWHLEFEDGTIVTIYDWKNNRTSFADHRWHIGGYDQLAVEHVMTCVRNHRDPLVRMVRDYASA
jgi:hypothetical protein